VAPTILGCTITIARTLYEREPPRWKKGHARKNNVAAGCIMRRAAQPGKRLVMQTAPNRVERCNTLFTKVKQHIAPLVTICGSHRVLKPFKKESVNLATTHP